MASMTAMRSDMYRHMSRISGAAFWKRLSVVEVFGGRKRVCNTTITLQESLLSRTVKHFKREARKNFGRRNVIEPVIGHFKKGLSADPQLPPEYCRRMAYNLLLAVAAFNCRKWMNVVSEVLLIILYTLRAEMSSHS